MRGDGGEVYTSLEVGKIQFGNAEGWNNGLSRIIDVIDINTTAALYGEDGIRAWTQ